MAMGLVWAGGALAAGWRIRFRRETVGHVVAGLAVGLGLLVVFLLGAGLVARIPLLAEPVDTLLAHARWGSLPAELAITVINAVAEELFFRGALFDALGRHALVWSTVAYTAVTLLSGVPLLALAGLLLGLAAALLRIRTRGIAAPITAHLTWTVGMLLLLPPALALWR